jgi:hypothetical protein
LIEQLIPGEDLYTKTLENGEAILPGRNLLAGRPFASVTSVPVLLDKNLHYFSKIFLHLWKFAVISQLRTNFAENARESLATLGAA